MAPRGMSAEDKRKTVLALFHDSKEPWLLKDMEKAAAQKGVVFQAVKDVVQSLVDDDMVHVDKVGTSNWYWAFPGEQAQKLQNQQERLEGEVKRAREELADIEGKVAKAKAEHPETEEFAMAQVMMTSAIEANQKVKAELEELQSGDSVVLETMKKGIPAAMEAANRWTDNTFILKSWVEKKMGNKEDTKQFFKTQAGINLDTFDYVE